MASFPKIQGPCPYQDQAGFAAMFDGDFCRLCKREVVDLSEWSDAQRIAFLDGCKEEVCVSYRLPMRPALAAAALSAGMALMPAAAAAQEVAAGQALETSQIEIVLTIGAIRDARAVEYIETDDAAGPPELPVVYEDEAPSPAPPPDSDQPSDAI
jgi:hypothetical protein